MSKVKDAIFEKRKKNVFFLIYFYITLNMLFVFIYISLPVPNARAVSRISGLILPDAFALGIVIFSIYISMGKMLAKKHDYEVDANQVCL
jgi:hypothetical protein